MLLKSINKYSFSDGILMLSLVLLGGFHEYISCLLAVAMSIYLLIRLVRERQLRVRMDLLTVAVAGVCLAYGLTCFWAVDRGMAFIGFLKFLPLFLYLLCLQQEQQPGHVLELLPCLGAVIAVVTGIGMQFPVGKDLFSVAGRLAGCFQYPNTFAVFLLVCELLLLKKAEKKIWDYGTLLILVAGLLYTGSRTAFIVAILANAGMLLCLSKKRMRTILLACIAGACLLAVLLSLGEGAVLRRYLTISLTESTFVGRLLYWVDALPLLAKHPFGMGYMGYYYTQQSIQTGVYSVVYAHNDFLQLLLDVGVIPGCLFLAVPIRFICKKSIPVADKIIVGGICLHSFFDFDLQFVGMFFLLILLLSWEETEKTYRLKADLLLKTGFVAVALAGLYMGTSLTMAHLGARKLADTLYPYNTQNKLKLLEQAQDLTAANTLAEEILAQNTHFYAPYSIKAKYAYSKGNFSEVIQYERQALERNPFSHSEYEAYCKMLITGIDLYQKAGDAQSAAICKKELQTMAKQLSANAQRLSPLGRMIDDQPVTILPDELQQHISKMGA